MRHDLRACFAATCALCATLLLGPHAALAEEVVVQDSEAQPVETDVPLDDPIASGEMPEREVMTEEYLSGETQGKEYTVDPSIGYSIKDGKVQAVFPYTPGTDLRSYDNATSNIVRFAVWVETSADTDADGKRDLVKAIVQLPRAAMEGTYKASVIYEANPSSAGLSSCKGYLYEDLPSATDLHLGALAKDGTKRTPAATIGTMQAVTEADPADWYYQTKEDRSMLWLRRVLGIISPLANPLFGGDAKSVFESTFGLKLDETWEYTNLTTYDNYLTQGYAVVLTAGLGSYGSEGLPCAGFGVEARAAGAVVEWLHGDRQAFADPEGTQAIVADWCSGNVAMTGRGYAGALAFEVASLGIEGLRTVVPVDGIASWYDYVNSQGEAYTNTYDGLSVLSASAGAGIAEGLRDKTVDNRFKFYLARMSQDQIALGGTYRPNRVEDEVEDDEDLSPWEFTDFSHRTGSFKVPALIVHGLNDWVVRTKQFELMRAAFAADRCDVKLLLTQAGFESPANEQSKTEIMVGSETYDDLLNRWFAHYLLGVDNGVEDLDHVMAQSNVDGSFFTYTTLATTQSMNVAPAAGSTQVISSKDAPRLLSEQYEVLRGTSTNFAAVWSADVDSDVTIQGSPEVVVRASTNTIDPADMAISVILSDEADEPFASYELDSSGQMPYEVVQEGGANRGDGIDAFDIVQYKTTDVTKHLVTMGAINLRCPDAGFDPRTARLREGGINAGEYYEYHVHLNPTHYTVRAGHHLRIYILTYATADAKTLFGVENEVAGRFGDYEVSIDTSGSYANIPYV